MSEHKQRDAEFIEDALKEMFRLVGREYDPEICSKDGWYLTSSWGLEQEHEFSRWWMREARKRLKWNRHTARIALSMFLLNYGWKSEKRSLVD